MNKEQVLNSTFLPVEQKSPLSSNQVDLSGPYYHFFPKAYVGRQGLFNKRPYTALKETDQLVLPLFLTIFTAVAVLIMTKLISLKTWRCTSTA